MRKFLLGLALLLCPVVAGAQIVTEPVAPFTGGTITTPLLGPDSCANPTYSFTSDPDSGWGSDGFGLCIRDDQYYNLQVNDGGGNIGILGVVPAGLELSSTDGTSSQQFFIDPFQGIAGDVIDGISESSTFSLVPGGWDLEQTDANYSLDEERVNGDISINAEFLATGDNADLFLSADVPVVRLQSTFGTDIAEINTNTGLQILLDADLDNDGDGLIQLRTDNSAQQVQLDSDSVDLSSNNEIDLTATNIVDINSTTLIDLDAGTSGAISLYAGSAPQDTLFDMDNNNINIRASGSGDYYVNVEDSGGFNGIVVHSEGSATTEGRITVLAGSVRIDGDNDNSGDGLVTIETDNSGQQIGLDSDSIDLASNNAITLNADDTTNNASLILNGVGNALALSVTDGTDVADTAMTQNTISLDADVDNDGDGAVTLEAANSTSQVVVDSTGVSITNYLFADSIAFASLGAPADGAIVYCSDCDAASTPCASTPGTGTFAFRQNGAWNCPF